MLFDINILGVYQDVHEHRFYVFGSFGYLYNPLDYWQCILQYDKRNKVLRSDLN